VATGDNLTAAKAVAAGVLGFLAPGAAYLIGAGQDGITSNEWVLAALWCIGGSAVVGGTVYAVENKPKARELKPPPGGTWLG
jgi:hypothetical protein